MKSRTLDHTTACDASMAETKTRAYPGSKRLIAASLSLALSLGAIASGELSNLTRHAENLGEFFVSTAWADTPNASHESTMPANNAPFGDVARLATLIDDGEAPSGITTASSSSLSTKRTEKAAAQAREEGLQNLIALAMDLAGTPYRYGGTTPRGFDCSGFTMYCFQNALGVELPRSAAAQSGLGESIPLSEAQPGDLVFWGSRYGVYHVGISLGDGQYIHAAASGSVRVESTAVYAPSFAKRIF